VGALACIGHWYTDLLYMVPVGLIAGVAGVDKAKQMARERDVRGRRRRHASAD
jgi:hypothetical protein